jgi:hypothetical protein
VLERAFSLKNVESTYLRSRRRASAGSLQHGPVGPGVSGLSPRTLATSGCQSRHQTDRRRGRQIRASRKRREPRRAPGQISFAWLACKFTSDCREAAPLQERSGWVRLSGISVCLRRLVSRQIVLWMPCQTALSRPRAHERSKRTRTMICAACCDGVWKKTLT